MGEQIPPDVRLSFPPTWREDLSQLFPSALPQVYSQFSGTLGGNCLHLHLKLTGKDQGFQKDSIQFSSLSFPVDFLLEDKKTVSPYFKIGYH